MVLFQKKKDSTSTETSCHGSIAITERNTFWMDGWQHALCRCANCLTMYEEQGLSFLLAYGNQATGNQEEEEEGEEEKEEEEPKPQQQQRTREKVSVRFSYRSCVVCVCVC